MSIGNHTFWVIVDLDTKAALTPESDHRRALQFISHEAAETYRKGLCRYRETEDQGNLIVVRIPE